MTKRDDCKRFKVIPHVGVQDDLTGKVYSNHREFAKALNEESDKRDKIAEKILNKYYDRMKLVQGHERWIKEIMKYIDCDEEYIIKFCLSYTLQSLKAGEDINRFKWNK